MTTHPPDTTPETNPPLCCAALARSSQAPGPETVVSDGGAAEGKIVSAADCIHAGNRLDDAWTELGSRFLGDLRWEMLNLHGRAATHVCSHALGKMAMLAHAEGESIKGYCDSNVGMKVISDLVAPNATRRTIVATPTSVRRAWGWMVHRLGWEPEQSMVLRHSARAHRATRVLADGVTLARTMAKRCPTDSALNSAYWRALDRAREFRRASVGDGSEVLLVADPIGLSRLRLHGLHAVADRLAHGIMFAKSHRSFKRGNPTLYPDVQLSRREKLIYYGLAITGGRYTNMDLEKAHLGRLADVHGDTMPALVAAYDSGDLEDAALKLLFIIGMNSPSRMRPNGWLQAWAKETGRSAKEGFAMWRRYRQFFVECCEMERATDMPVWLICHRLTEEVIRYVGRETRVVSYDIDGVIIDGSFPSSLDAELRQRFGKRCNLRVKPVLRDEDLRAMDLAMIAA